MGKNISVLSIQKQDLLIVFSLQALVPFVEPSAKTNMIDGHGPHAVAGKFAAANGMAAATAGSTWVLEVR